MSEPAEYIELVTMLATERKLRGLKVDDLADAMGWGRNTTIHYEKGHRAARGGDLYRWAAFLGFDITYRRRADQPPAQIPRALMNPSPAIAAVPRMWG